VSLVRTGTVLGLLYVVSRNPAVSGAAFRSGSTSIRRDGIAYTLLNESMIMVLELSVVMTNW
jgi:hypothetical protein